MRRKNYIKIRKSQKDNPNAIFNICRETVIFQRKYRLPTDFDPLKTNVKKRIIEYKTKDEKKPVPLPVNKLNSWQMNPFYIAIVNEKRIKNEKLRKGPGIVITRPHIGENGLKIKCEKGLNCKQQRNMNKYGYSSYVKYRESLK